jgi:hypothetical protein
MKVFRKELYYKATGKTEELVKSHKITWPMECDGKEVEKNDSSYQHPYRVLGTPYGADEAWLEEVCDIEREADREQMKDWKIGTEHVIRKNGKDIRVVVERSYDEKAFTCRTHCALYQFIKDVGCCDAHKCVGYARPDLEGVYYKEVTVPVHKPLVLKLFFSPERNMTFTEHDINPEVGFVTGKYYRFIGKESDIRMTLLYSMRNILEHKVLTCTNGSGRKANFEGIGDLNNDLMYRWMYDGDEKKEFVFWKEMRPFVTAVAPDIITFDELSTQDDKDKEKPNMKVDENFTFKKKMYGTTLHAPKVVKTHKCYANDGACEACGAIINKGDFVLTANETDCNKVTKKTHRLCVNCTAEYIKAKSAAELEKPTYTPITGFETGKWYVCHAKARLFGWNRNGKMDGLLDGKPHKCIFGKGVYAGFEDIPRNDEFLSTHGWRFGGQLDYFEEVPAPLASYAERQAQWIKDNNIKEGTKVRVTRTFTSCEDGCKVQFTPMKGTFIGDDCIVWGIESNNITVRSSQKDDWWCFPYFVLEVLPEEPWFKIGDKVRITIKSSVAYNKIGTVTDVHMHKDGTQTVYMNFAEFCGTFCDTRAFNADKPEKIGELYVPSYKELQDAWIAKHNLKEGDRVVILRTAKDRENGWPNSWCDTMNNKVGQMYKVEGTKEKGIALSCGYQWPYFVLGVVKE